MFEFSKTKKDTNWRLAMDQVASLGPGWRIPTKQELSIIVNSPRAKEFTADGWFWSSSGDVDNTAYAWGVNCNGDVDRFNKANILYVKYVKGEFNDLVAWCFGEPVPEVPYTTDKEKNFQEELRALLNRYSLENGSNTPDFILASYLQNCLKAYDQSVQEREKWYGRGPKFAQKGLFEDG